MAGPRERGYIHDHSSDQIVPQEKPAATKAVPSNKHVLIVGGFAGIAGDAATMTQDGHPVLESGHLRSSGFVT